VLPQLNSTDKTPYGAKNRILACIRFVLCILLIGYRFAWGGLDEGFSAFDRGDYAAAMQEWKPL
jgi:hypothetical protein